MGRWLVWALLLAACSAPAAIHPPTSTIRAVGLIADQRIYSDRIEFRLEGGLTWEGQVGSFRQILDWGARLLVVGTDPDGLWIATLGPQQGLPADCNFIPEPGTDWGDGIAIAGVLWQKAPGFSADETPGVGNDYPGGTRFCVNEHGQVASTIPNGP